MTDQELEDKIFKYLSENLVIDVDTQEEYVGSLGDGNGNLYKSYHTVKLYLGDKVISSTYLSWSRKMMNRDELIEHQREEIKALKAANLDLQIHFDTIKAELEDAKAQEPWHTQEMAHACTYFNTYGEPIELNTAPEVKVFINGIWGGGYSTVLIPTGAPFMVYYSSPFQKAYFCKPNKLQQALDSGTIQFPRGLTGEERRAFIKEKLMKTIEDKIPNGYKLVPIEPTKEMLEAFHIAISLWLDEIGEDADVYKAMLLAYTAQ